MDRPQNLKPLTAMRIFAAYWVVLYHYWPALTSAPMPGFVARGYLGVELFFVLSGFILAHVYLEAFGAGKFSYRSFIWARLARIYPLHLAILVGLIALVVGAGVVGLSVGEHLALWPSLPAQFLLLQAWGLSPLGGWNHPSWSISAEWFAYVTFPVFAFVAWRLRARPWVAVALAAALVLLLNWVFPAFVGLRLTAATIAWGAIRIVPCFALGCAVFLLWRSGPQLSSRRSLLLTAGIAIAAGVTSGFDVWDAVTVLLFGGLIFGLASLASSGSRVLSSPVGVYLGEVSFAVYMTCIPWELVFTQVARRALHLPEGPLPWPLWIVLFLGVIPISMAAHHLVERPARDAMRAWEKRWNAASAYLARVRSLRSA